MRLLSILLPSIAVLFARSCHAFVGHKRPPIALGPRTVSKNTATTNTILFAANQDLEQPPSVNLGLVAQNIANQAILGCTLWTGGYQYDVFVEKATFDTLGIGLGLVGLAPLLAISRQIENSENYLFSGLNLSTNMAVLRLFGAKKQPVVALALSALMASLTGVVEEVTFRGSLIPVLANNLGEGDILTGAALSTVIFAVLHTNPLSLIKPQNKDAFLDNWVLLLLQMVNGGIFAGLYLSTNNLAAPIVAHALYDFYTFYKTHLVDVAGQMEYAQEESQMPQCKNTAIETRWVAQRGQDFVTNAKRTFYLVDTNKDGELSRKELRVALFSYGINLSREQSEKVVQKVDQDDSGDIDFQEFLEFVGPTGSTGKAVRNTLFGPL